MTASGPLWRSLLLLAGLAAAGLAMRHLLPGGTALAAAGLPGFVLLGALACAVGAPRQAIAYAGGYGFGLTGGVALAMAAQIVACALDFLWARMLARRWVRRRIAGRWRWLDRTLAGHPFAATLMLRLLPVGSNLALNLLAGASEVPAAPFLAGSALGYLPQTIVFAAVGTGTRLGHAREGALGVALFAVAAALGVWLLGRLRAEFSAADFSEDASDAPYAATRRR